eukprot:5501217-Lingulodinium_polyedra.AAC.1
MLGFGASQCQPCRALQRVALDARTCIGLGAHDTLHNCWDLSQPECMAKPIEDWLIMMGRLAEH